VSAVVKVASSGDGTIRRLEEQGGQANRFAVTTAGTHKTHKRSWNCHSIVGRKSVCRNGKYVLRWCTNAPVVVEDPSFCRLKPAWGNPICVSASKFDPSPVLGLSRVWGDQAAIASC
jgi:hypothetical protein